MPEKTRWSRASKAPRPHQILGLGHDARAASGRTGRHRLLLPDARGVCERHAAESGFLETRLYNDNFYGTPRSFINETLLHGYDVIMKPEVNGAIAIKAAFPEAVLIFILPDHFSLLQARLEARRTETNDDIAPRLDIAHEELRYVRLFDYLLVNEEAHPERAVDDLEAIVRAERKRIYRWTDRRSRKSKNLNDRRTGFRRSRRPAGARRLEVLARQRRDEARQAAQQRRAAADRQRQPEQARLDRLQVKSRQGRSPTNGRVRASSKLMCGIVGYIGERDSVPMIMDSLRRLEYRGYDSAGIAVIEADGKLVGSKAEGKLQRLAERLANGEQLHGTIGVGHTRWATHGRPSDANAHPHLDCCGKIAVVHNGIIENYASLRDELLANGHVFRSETDTEVLAHLIEPRHHRGDLVGAVRTTLAESAAPTRSASSRQTRPTG